MDADVFDWRLSGERQTEMLTRLCSLGDGVSRSTVLTDAFCLWRDGQLAIYYAPFHVVNRNSRIALVGITPGPQQVAAAARAAAEAMAAGKSHEEAVWAAKRVGSFAGGMRANLTSKLDQIGVAAALDLRTCALLFGERRDLLHTTSALRWPVMVGGRGYSGHRPGMLDHPVLKRAVETTLCDELAAIPDALIVPLGVAVEEALHHLTALGRLDAERCAFGFPHPSGANGHRARMFAERRDRLKTAVEHWFAGAAEHH
jgi:hypothetical protein